MSIYRDWFCLKHGLTRNADHCPRCVAEKAAKEMIARLFDGGEDRPPL